MRDSRRFGIHETVAMAVVDMHAQAVRGVTPPSVAEARIAIRWPSVARFPFVSKPASALQDLGKNLIVSAIRLPWFLAIPGLIITVPLGTLIAFVAWLMLAPFYFLKILPVFMTRYVVTNRRVRIEKGWSLRPVAEVALEELEEVRVVPGSDQPFYLAADLELVAGGRPMLTLHGVREFRAFKIIIDDARLAWGRKNPPKEQIHPAK